MRRINHLYKAYPQRKQLFYHSKNLFCERNQFPESQPVNPPFKSLNSITNEERTKVYVAGIMAQFSKKDLLKKFDPSGNEIIDIVHVLNRVGEKTDKVLLSFARPDFAAAFAQKWSEEFIELNGVTKRLNVRIFDLKMEKTKLTWKKNSPRQLLVYNLNFQSVEEDLLELASRFGEVEELKILKDKNNPSLNKGEALLLYKTQDGAEKFLEYADGFTFDGRQIKIKAKDFKFDSQLKRTKLKSESILDKFFLPLMKVPRR